jgi:ABC-2 type transport system permease protein
VIFLISFTFTVLGFAIAWQMDSTQGFHAIMNLVLLPLWLVSGSLFPMANAHGWVQWLMRLNPVTYTVAALRQALEHDAATGVPTLSTSLAVTATCAALLFAASTAFAHRKSIRSFA